MTFPDLFPADPLLVVALYYLIARAEVTRPLWSRYPARLDRLALCPACLGFWLGCTVAAVHVGTSAFGCADALGIGPSPTPAYVYVLHAGLSSLVTTPILFGLMRLGFGARDDTGEPEPAETKGA